MAQSVSEWYDLRNETTMTNDQPDILKRIYERARAADAAIAIADSGDERVVEASKIIEHEKLAQLVLIDEKTFENLPENEQRELEAAAGDSKDLIVSNTKYLAAAYVKTGKADGFVAGHASPTSETIRAALKIIGTKEKYASSFFIMLHKGLPLIFADCAFNPQPTPEQLARIAIETSHHAQELGIEPRVAFLSFSTAGSAEHEMVGHVREAIQHAQKLAPEIAIAEQEMQFDAAFDPTVATQKGVVGPVAGQANVFIFPDLNSGNIGYKIAQYMGGASAIGPVFQGFNAPVNDLSRGCSVQDIVDVVAITAFQTTL